MSEPQVQVFVVRTRTGSAFGWRVLSRNHREVGRSAVHSASGRLARGDVARVRALARQGVLRPVLSSRPAEGGWRWSLLAGDVPVAVSHRAYARRRECLAPLQQFVELMSGPSEVRVVELPATTFRPGRSPLPPRPAGAPLLELAPRRQEPLVPAEGPLGEPTPPTPAARLVVGPEAAVPGSVPSVRRPASVRRLVGTA